MTRVHGPAARARSGDADITDIEAAVREPTPVGDLDSDARGSGARFNAGKTPYDLVPLGVLARSMLTERADSAPARAMALLGAFQATRNVHYLYAIAQELGFGGWAECAAVFAHGKKKYAAWNWSKGMAWSVPLACAARHLIAMHGGQEIDPADRQGSGLPHRGHVFCNLCMLITYAETYPEGADLPPPGALA